MKVKVLKNFIDKDTKAFNRIGTPKKPTVIDVTAKRAKELLEAGNYIEMIEDDDAEDDESIETQTVDTLGNAQLLASQNDADSVEDQDDAVDAQDGSDLDETQNTSDDVEELEEMSLEELKQHAAERGIKLKGARTKATIIETIKTAKE